MKNSHYSLFPIHYSGNKGTTLVELLIVIAIVAVISAVGLLNLLGRNAQTDLNNTTEQMASLLREARNRSVAQASSTSWGVRFSNPTTTTPFYALFFSQTYSSSTTLGYYRLPYDLAYSTATVPSGSSTDITFSQLSGQATASTSINIYATKSGISNSSTINIASSGAISF